ncbi:MAG: hypothetical protein IT563_09725 [Alphaproteobacteria bacterium]|nr:hypothetical protein [Alphaproteobacteria bacterium]
MRTTIQTFSGLDGHDGQPLLMDEREIEFTAAQVDAIRSSQLAASDAGMARVVEDLVDALVAKGVLDFADLAPAAQDKITARKALRSRP